MSVEQIIAILHERHLHSQLINVVKTNLLPKNRKVALLQAIF